MRLKKRDSALRVNGEVAVEFGRERLTSFSGLEFLGRFLRRIELSPRLHRCFRGEGVGGDYGLAVMGRLVVALLWVGG